MRAYLARIFHQGFGGVRFIWARYTIAIKPEGFGANLLDESIDRYIGISRQDETHAREIWLYGLTYGMLAQATITYQRGGRIKVLR